MKSFIKQNKGILLLCAIFIILFIGLAFSELSVTKQQAVKVDKEGLQMLANEKAMQVNCFLESKKEMLGIIASMNVFKDAIKFPNDTAKIGIAKDGINELKSVLPGISLLNSEGIVSVGDIDLPGTDYSQNPYFLAKRQDIMFGRYYDPLRKGDYYAIAGPVYDDADKSKIIGRIAFDIELDELSALMKETLGGETTEVYLIDETGLLLSGSKYIGVGNKNGVLIQEVQSDGAKACLDDLKKYEKNGSIEEHENHVLQYKNYMGNEVFGAHAYVSYIKGCVIAEISADEVSKSSLTGHIISIIS